MTSWTDYTTTITPDFRYEASPSVTVVESSPPLYRQAEFRGEGDGNTLEGIAAVFDTPTVIDSWEGRFVETISRSAFDRTLREDRPPVMQFDHGHHPLLGSIPLGRIEEITPKTAGLFVRARLSDNWLIEPVRDAIRDGAVSGMSFMFNVLSELRSDDSEVAREFGMEHREVTDVRLHELGPVVFPAYPETSVGVRSLEGSLDDPNTRSELAKLLVYAGVDSAEGTGLSANATEKESRKPMIGARVAAVRLRLRGF